MTATDVLIVGTGHAGAQTAISLRNLGFSESITVIGDEDDPPYERPALSKEYLAGGKPFERLLLRPATFWSDRDIALRLRTRIAMIDPIRRHAVDQDGEATNFRALVWAAGGRPRSLTCDGAALGGVHSVRSRLDVDRLMTELPSSQRVVIVGGGYIGLEVAAVLSKLGKDVTLLEAFDRVLSRVAAEPISHFYELEHRKHGVDIRTGVSVSYIQGRAGKVVAVQLEDGGLIPADLVIVGIGITPNIQPLAFTGVTTSNGVHVDEYCETNIPDVFAIGDCALHHNRFAEGQRVRIESVQNANDQALTVARRLTNSSQPYDSVPWFWSNQYDLKLQTVGLARGFDDLVVRGNPQDRSFTVVYLRQGRVIALDCVNAVKDFVQGKALVQAGARLDAKMLSKSDLALKDMEAVSTCV